LLVSDFATGPKVLLERSVLVLHPSQTGSWGTDGGVDEPELQAAPSHAQLVTWTRAASEQNRSTIARWEGASARPEEEEEEATEDEAPAEESAAPGGEPESEPAPLDAGGDAPAQRFGLAGAASASTPCVLGWRSRQAQARFTYSSTRRLPPHLTQVNTSTANVLRTSPAKVYWPPPLLPPLLPRPCLRLYSRLLCSYLGTLHAPLLRTCLGVLIEYMESMMEGIGRSERRRALEWYVTGLLLEGERKSIEPMAARLVEDKARVGAMRQRLQ
jgi:hypothetical protein